MRQESLTEEPLPFPFDDEVVLELAKCVREAMLRPGAVREVPKGVRICFPDGSSVSLCRRRAPWRSSDGRRMEFRPGEGRGWVWRIGGWEAGLPESFDGVFDHLRGQIHGKTIDGEGLPGKVEKQLRGWAAQGLDL
jgi:hypothetical protein